MDVNDLRALITVLAFAAFVGIVVWAWSGRRKKRFEEAARLPLEEDRPVKDKSVEEPERGKKQ